jgi:hypothetical protein
MLNLNLNKKYKLNKTLKFYYLKKHNIVIIKNILGVSTIYLPSYYLQKKNNADQFSFIFLKKYFFKSFIAHFFTNYINSFNIFVVRLKMKGLGYQIYKITNKLYSFHFNFINFFYLLVPSSIYIN